MAKFMGWSLEDVRSLDPHEHDELVLMVKASTAARPDAG